MKLPRLLLTGLLGLTWTLPILADDAPEVDEEFEQKICVDARRVLSFDGLTDQHVFIEERARIYYLMTMRGYCPGLHDAEAIIIRDTMSRVCSGEFGEVYYRDFALGRRSCRIDTIERVQNKDEARAIIAERKEHDRYERAQEDDDKDE